MTFSISSYDSQNRVPSYEIDFNIFERNPQLNDLMRIFCEESHVDFDQAKNDILLGEKLVVSMKQDPFLKGDRETVRALMWYFTAVAATKNKHHFNGALRIQDPDSRLYRYIQESLRNDPHPIYVRISTHMNEYKSSQWGIDYEKHQLPANKRSILMRHLPESDNRVSTTYIKLEKAGCPPFWKKGFRTYGNFMTFVHHALELIKSKCCTSSRSSLKSRHEYVSRDFKVRYKKALRGENKKLNFRLYALFKRSNLSNEEKVFKRELKRALREGKVYGTTKMLDHLIRFENHHFLSPDVKFQIAVLKRDLLQIKTLAEEEGYLGAIKGDEVLLSL